jgi:hypothetical protein
MWKESIMTIHLEGQVKLQASQSEWPERVEIGTLDPLNKWKCCALECFMRFSQTQNLGTSNKLINYNGKNISESKYKSVSLWKFLSYEVVS